MEASAPVKCNLKSDQAQHLTTIAFETRVACPWTVGRSLSGSSSPEAWPSRGLIRGASQRLELLKCI